MSALRAFTPETIVAPATAPGEGAIGIIRLSGPQAASLLASLFQPSRTVHPLVPQRLWHGHAIAADGTPLDEVLAVRFPAPHSYTGEDVVEIHGHGNPLLLRRLVDRCLDLGARLARPGEFTQRAFLNGKIDLTRAEAVADLIASRSEAAQRLAVQQLDGRLQRSLESFRESLLQLLALIEAHIDFPEEEIDQPLQQRMLTDTADLGAAMDGLLDSFNCGRVLREGLAVLIVGRPNVGKSSLLNALLGEARAIVTAVPGTTRDLIEEQLHLDGLPLRLIDTAGIRDSDDLVEQEGIRRTHERLASADQILLVIDGHAGPVAADEQALAACDPERVLLVINKSDLPLQPLSARFAALPQVAVSARSGAGLADLRHALVSAVTKGSDSVSGQFFLSDRRHREALLASRRALRQFAAGIEAAAPLECLALELREALQALGELTGETTPDEILQRIFSRFCIGK